MKLKAKAQSELKRILGLRSLFAIAVGVVVAQVAFVSVLQGVGIGGANFFVALVIAFILALFYVFTFAELALMLPKAGSLSMYTEVSLGHFFAIIAVIAGYIAPAIFGLPAELFLLEAIFEMLYPGSFGQIGLVILIGLAILNVLGVDIFSRVVSSLFGETGKFILAVLAITATCSTINSVLATLPRMLFGMAHNKQVPSIFMKIHPRTQTPWVGITSMVILILVPYLIFKNAQDVVIVMIISAATVWLVAYIFGYINLLILRKKYPNFNRPFKSPFYPWAQIIGILAMVYMIFNNSPTPDMTFQVYMNAGILVLIASIYAGLWVKYKMKKGLFEPEPIDQALKN
jgi:amino acid transporter